MTISAPSIEFLGTRLDEYLLRTIAGLEQGEYERIIEQKIIEPSSPLSVGLLSKVDCFNLIDVLELLLARELDRRSHQHPDGLAKEIINEYASELDLQTLEFSPLSFDDCHAFIGDVLGNLGTLRIAPSDYRHIAVAFQVTLQSLFAFITAFLEPVQSRDTTASKSQ